MEPTGAANRRLAQLAAAVDSSDSSADSASSGGITAGTRTGVGQRLPTANNWRNPRRVRTACIIGHTDHGNFGHGLDELFEPHPRITVLGVADAGGEAALAASVAKTNAQLGYADYHAMLEIESPDVVIVAPRWSEEHHAMGTAALRAGAHVFFEKPFTPSLAEVSNTTLHFHSNFTLVYSIFLKFPFDYQADELLAEAKKQGKRCAIAHQVQLLQ